MLQDSVRDLETAVELKQAEVNKAGDRRVLAYSHNRELHTRDARALAQLISFAGDAPQQVRQGGPPHPARSNRSRTERAHAPAPAWSVRSTLRDSLASLYTPPNPTPKRAAPAPSSSSSSATRHIPPAIPTALSGPSLLAAIPQQAVPGLPYTCAPSKAAAAAAMHVRTAHSQNPAARAAAATVVRLGSEIRHQAQAAAAAEESPGAPVRWFLQSPWQLVDGSPIALTTDMSSPASLVSFYFCSFLLQLEEFFIVAALYPSEHLPSVPGAAPRSWLTPRPDSRVSFNVEQARLHT